MEGGLHRCFLCDVPLGQERFVIKTVHIFVEFRPMSHCVASHRVPLQGARVPLDIALAVVCPVACICNWSLLHVSPHPHLPLVSQGST